MIIAKKPYTGSSCQTSLFTGYVKLSTWSRCKPHRCFVETFRAIVSLNILTLIHKVSSHISCSKRVSAPVVWEPSTLHSLHTGGAVNMLIKYTGRSFNLCVTICFTTSAVVSRAFIIEIFFHAYWTMQTTRLCNIFVSSILTDKLARTSTENHSFYKRPQPPIFTWGSPRSFCCSLAEPGPLLLLMCVYIDVQAD